MLGRKLDTMTTIHNPQFIDCTQSNYTALKTVTSVHIIFMKTALTIFYAKISKTVLSLLLVTLISSSYMKAYRLKVSYFPQSPKRLKKKEKYQKNCIHCFMSQLTYNPRTPLIQSASPIRLVRAVRAVYAALHGTLSAVSSILALSALLLCCGGGVPGTRGAGIGSVATTLHILAVALGTGPTRRSTIHAVAHGGTVARWHTLGVAVVALLRGLVLLLGRCLLLLVGPQLLLLLDGCAVARQGTTVVA